MDVRFKADKLLFHPKVFKKFIESPDSVFPVSAEITLTNRCNLGCVWCVDKDWRHISDNAEIDIKVLLKNVKILKDNGLTGVTLEGGGEPTLHTRFNEIAEEIFGMGISIGLITNGVRRIDKPELFKWIRVSLDASNQFEYEKIKKQVFFEDVMENIKFYASKCRLVGVAYILSKETGEDIVPVIRKIKKWGAKYIQFRTVTEHPELYTKHLPVSWELVEALDDREFKVYNHQVFHEAESGNFGLPCYSHNLTTVIGGNGDVDFCCRLRAWDLEKTKIGNLYEEDIDKILKGKKWEELSKLCGNKEWAEKNCPVCRLSKYNSMRYQIVEDRLDDWAFL